MEGNFGNWFLMKSNQRPRRIHVRIVTGKIRWNNPYCTSVWFPKNKKSCFPLSPKAIGKSFPHGQRSVLLRQGPIPFGTPRFKFQSQKSLLLNRQTSQLAHARASLSCSPKLSVNDLLLLLPVNIRPHLPRSLQHKTVYSGAFPLQFSEGGTVQAPVHAVKMPFPLDMLAQERS